MLSPREEIIWLAAILEGEGYFGLMKCNNSKVKKDYFSPRVAVGMTDQDVVEHVARLFGTTTTSHPGQYGGKRVYRAAVYGEKGRWIMRQVLPFMGERRTAKINEVLSHPAAYKRKPKPWPFYEAVGVEPEW